MGVPKIITQEVETVTEAVVEYRQYQRELAPTTSYGAPIQQVQQTYAAPVQQTYAAPTMSYAAPTMSYAAPTTSYAAPTTYAAPTMSYAAPATYGATYGGGVSYGAPTAFLWRIWRSSLLWRIWRRLLLSIR